MRGESLKCYCYNLKNIKNIGIYIAAIVLLKIVFLLFAFSKGELDSYLKIVIPAAVISMVIILYTCAMKSDYTFAVISILLLDIGTTMQVLISESPDRYILLQGIALVLGAILLIAVCMVQKHFSYKQQWLICLIASRNGCDSMSPMVPPISVITTSAPVLSPRAYMKDFISFVTCGIICTVDPRYSPFLSFCRTFQNVFPDVRLENLLRSSSMKRS